MPVTYAKNCAEHYSDHPVKSRLEQKRLMDVLLSLVLLPAVLPLAILIGAILKIQGGPILYSQVRVGRDGLPFRLWKFRTMIADADAVLQKHLDRHPSAKQEWRDHRKLRNDPRVTRFGAFLRRCSLDELPQFWNIFLGEMSLVGPRPVSQNELEEKYRQYALSYMRCRPGLTGLWQVSGRNRLTYESRVQLDDYYARQQNALLDLWILWRTIGAVLRGTGC
ncbi:MAG TPA: sugar transferase [Rhodobacteraceae bacterium]|nr:sugar transferase [Paracoccaceae bacterium]